MKKLILAIIGIAFFAMVSNATAAGSNPPKTLCLNWDSFSDFDVLVVKSMGTVKTADGPVKQFGIFGHADNGSLAPVAGSGYVVPGTTTFHATFNGTFDDGSFVGNYELFYDIASGTGTIFYLYPDLTASGSDTVTLGDCKTQSIVAAPSGLPNSAQR